MLQTERTLLRLHIEAVWGVQLPPIIQNSIDIRAEGQQPEWALYVARLAHEHSPIHIWRSDVSSADRARLLKYTDEALAPTISDSATPGISREVALHFTASPTLDMMSAHHKVYPITPDDRVLVETFEPGSAEYFFDVGRGPLFGIVSEGRLLCMAHSSRRTSDACELGIETLPIARRRGYALAATVLWTDAVIQEGLVPLYSALVENTASLKLAHAAGYREFVRGATIDLQ